MTRLISLLFITLFTGACNSQSASEQISSYTDSASLAQLYERDTLANGHVKLRPKYSLHKTVTTDIELTFFDTVPETISNTGEFYSYDTTKLAAGKYIFLTNLTEFAILKNKGRDVYLKKEHDKCLQLSENEFKDVFSGNGFTAILIHNKIEHKDGATYEKGTLEIQNSSHQRIFKVHGGYKM